jgi:hypothetical protein
MNHTYHGHIATFVGGAFGNAGLFAYQHTLARRIKLAGPSGTGSEWSNVCLSTQRTRKKAVSLS